MWKRLIKYDLYNGILKKAAVYFVIVPFVIIYAQQYSSYMGMLSSGWETDMGGVTVGDFLLYLYEGVFFPESVERFVIPFRYLLLMLLPIWMTASYPCRDWKERGSLMFPRIRDVRKWWISKSIWLALSLLCYYFVVIISVMLSAALFGISLDLAPGDMTVFYFGAGKVTAGSVVLYTFVMPYLLLLGLCLLQMLVSIIWNLAVGFVFQILILCTSFFVRGPLSLGSYFMTWRTCMNLVNGLNAWTGIAIGLLLQFLSVMLGIIIIRKKDIL